MSTTTPQQIKAKTIIEQIGEELKDFRENKMILAKGDANVKDSGYMYSQSGTINAIELAYNSVFRTGKYDSEGRRKVYMNVVKFRAEVAMKQTDIDVKHYVFVPDTHEHIYKTAIQSYDFKRFVRKNGHAKLINELNVDYSKYGTWVLCLNH